MNVSKKVTWGGKLKKDVIYDMDGSFSENSSIGWITPF
jgi:hypothetical protein